MVKAFRKYADQFFDPTVFNDSVWMAPNMPVIRYLIFLSL